MYWAIILIISEASYASAPDKNTPSAAFLSAGTKYSFLPLYLSPEPSILVDALSVSNFTFVFLSHKAHLYIFLIKNFTKY